MKAICPDCGCHFPDEFEQSLKCSFWHRKGLDKLPKKYKKVVWDWLFSLPCDELADKGHFALSVQLFGYPYKGNQWSEKIEGYDNWTEEERRKYQKLYFLEAMGRDVKLIPDKRKKKK